VAKGRVTHKDMDKTDLKQKILIPLLRPLMWLCYKWQGKKSIAVLMWFMQLMLLTMRWVKW